MAEASKIEGNRENDGRVTLPNGQKRFAKGNTIGRMKKKGFTLTDLNKVVVKYEKTHGVTILKHYVEQLLKDNRLLDKYIDRNVPLKQELEIKAPDTIRIKAFIQAGEEPVIKEEEPKKIEEKVKGELQGEDTKETETVL